MLLNDVIDDVFYDNDIFHQPEGKDIIKGLAVSEHSINYYNLFCKSGNINVKTLTF